MRYDREHREAEAMLRANAKTDAPDLPPLPEPVGTVDISSPERGIACAKPGLRYFNADMMRQYGRACFDAGRAAADKQWSAWGTIEIAVRNPAVAEFMRHWEGRAEAAEREVAEVKSQLGKHFQHCPDLIALTKERAELRAKLEAVQGFAQWLTGCGYDFTQHQYFIDNRHLLSAARGSEPQTTEE